MILTLIDSKNLKEYTIIPNNYDLNEVWNSVKMAENLYILPILGLDLYNELIDEVENNNVTPANASLLLLIYSYEGAAFTELALPILAYRLNEAGINKIKTDNTEALSVNELNYFNNYVHAQLEPLKKQLIDFLNEHLDLYPLYKQEQTPKFKKIYGFNPINTDIDGNKLNLI